jgi:hypothetical protein
LFSFWSGSAARVFAYLLGAYLAGIAVGGLVAHDLTNRPTTHRSKHQYLHLIARFVVLASLAGFVAAPAMGLVAEYLPIYGLRVGNFLALSDSPIIVNSDRLENKLRDYRIDGKLVFDLENPRPPRAFTR